MKSFGELIECGQKYAHAKKEMSVVKYKAFVEYLKKVIILAFEDNKEQIISYLKEMMYPLSLNWTEGNVTVGFDISPDDDDGSFNIEFRTCDSYNSIMKLKEYDDDETIVEFFDRSYKQFLGLFVPTYWLEDSNEFDKSNSIIYRIVNKFNEACYNSFKEYFFPLGINNQVTFNNSNFSLNFSKPKRLKLDRKVYDYYDSFKEKSEELTKQFEESVKDLK